MLSLSIPWVDLGLFSFAAALGVDGQILPMMAIHWGKCLDFLGLCRIHQFTVARMCGMWENVCCPADQRQRTNPETHMQALHTPLPWYHDGSSVRVSSVTLGKPFNYPVGLFVATADPLTESQAEANAAFIVRAVNSHDELVAVVSELAVWEADPNRYGGDLADLGQRARALLSRLSV